MGIHRRRGESGAHNLLQVRPRRSMSNSGRLRSLLSLNANQCKPNRRLKLRTRPRSPRALCSWFGLSALLLGALAAVGMAAFEERWVKTPYETPVARRSFVSITMPSPRASLYANGQCVSEGNAEVFVSQGRGNSGESTAGVWIPHIQKPTYTSPDYPAR